MAELAPGVIFAQIGKMYVECNVIACWPLQYALMFRKMWLLLPIAAALSGCADGSFGRFMDHPIASWLPVEDLGEPGHHPFEPPPRRADIQPKSQNP